MYYIGKDNYVTGKLSGQVAKFSLTVNGVEYSKVNVTAAPDFKYYANSLIKNVSDIVKVNAYDANGRLLDSKPLSITTYQGEEGKITSAAPFKLGKDSYVTGAYTGDVRKVELQVNGVALQRINVLDGIIKYYAKANIAKATDEVKLVGFNAAGVAVSTKPITITTTDGSVTANPFALGKDGYVTGAYTGDVAKISLTVNGVKQSTISVPAGSEFKYYAKTLIKNASDVVVLTAYDTIGGVLSTVNIAIDNSTTMTSGTVTPNTFKIGTNSYVDGTYTGDVAKVELEVNGIKYGQIPATGNTIHYFAASLITQTSDLVKVNVYDTAGKQLDSKLVSLTAPTGTVTAANAKVGDSYLSGTATGDVTKVTLSVNGTVQSSVAFVQADKSYRYYIKNLNLKPTDDVKIVGMDARGNTLNISDVTINN
ncbi:cell wall anchor domain-containing protein [Listeria riparia FSL S10-1204]|uniref:Cell wall anchor domain-containing protein n=2 Tax=Listeria riparia TaxID=1494964 RepID=W7D0E6_9LIST|nr:immunoglobulin-like domain-containing protein [Listeria riparia]EUJ42662.1 cell wall anchor domain-containing protein [Listeria riparia FSL S10-1204]